ncbi:hypothetical protein HYW76_01585 [Candidatus Pacearchaeota archaeon]|nr:hypothetical protein [Candidatus Pacearchaeota archaeon]
MGKLKSVYSALLNRGEKVMKRKEIVKLIEDYKKIKKINTANALWYLSRQRYIKRIFLDYYYINSIEEREQKFCKYLDKELLFLVLNKINLKWYLGLTSARYSLGEIWQTPNMIIIINNKFSGNRVITDFKTRFIKLKESLIFALIKGKTDKGIEYYYSDKEKTELDEIYLSKKGRVAKDKRTKTYLKRYPKWLQKLI